MNKIFNEDCLVTMERLELQRQVDLVLTSPPYNTSRPGDADKYCSRYDSFSDLISDREYIDWTIKIFNGYDKILKENGCVLFNLSYSSEKPYLVWMLIAEVIKKTNFITADTIIWKKSCALPNNASSNKLTRIIEYVFVMCRKDELKTFKCNKKVRTISTTGQKFYENIFNFIEAKNNDGSNELNKATFSTNFVRKLLAIYAQPNSLVYDSFMGTGTTARGCILENQQFIGSELSEKQIEFALKENEKLLKKG
jgi:DNA modification methylase